MFALDRFSFMFGSSFFTAYQSAAFLLMTPLAQVVNKKEELGGLANRKTELGGK